MKIAMVVYSHYSRDARVRRYAEALAEKNIIIDILCLKENYHPKESNIKLFYYPLPRRRYGKMWNIFEYLIFLIYSTLFLSLIYFFKRYKVVHVHNMPEFLVFSGVLPKIFGAKIILDMHDPMPELYMSKYHTSENSLMVKWLKWLEGLSLKFADHILTANEEFKKIFHSRHKIEADKISVILNCPDSKIFNRQHIPDNRKQFSLIYMGTVEKRFGLDIAIEAMPDLIKKIPHIRFIIIPKLENEGEYFKKLEFRIKHSELKNFVQILPPMPLEEIADTLKKADIGVVLAKNGIFTETIFPVNLLEFVQMKIPVVASRTKSIVKYFDKSSICYLKNNTSEDFTKGVVDLWKSVRLRKKITINSLKYFKLHNWKVERQKYYNILKI